MGPRASNRFRRCSVSAVSGGGTALEPVTDPSPVVVPGEYLCPISQELMSDPVLSIASGHTYERCAPILSRVRATEF